MPLGDFVEAGTSPRPLLIGRAGQLGFGAFTLYVFAVNLVDYDAFVSTDASDPDVLYWVAVGFAWWYFSDLVVVGFGRRSGRWPQVAVFPFAAVLVVADLVAYESAWGPPLGWGVFSFTEFFYLFIGISFLLAAVLRVPG